MNVSKEVEKVFLYRKKLKKKSGVFHGDFNAS